MPQLLLGDLDLLADPYTALVGSSWGEWQAITTTTDSLFVDGSVVSGEQSGNRTIALQVLVQSDVRPTLVQACEALFAQANLAANTLTFVPDDGLPVVYDVFRAQPERTDDQSEAWGYRTYTFTFPALPFARSDRRTSTGALQPPTPLEDFEGSPTVLALGTSASDASTGISFLLPMAAANTVSAMDAHGMALVPDANCGPLTSEAFTETSSSGSAYVGTRVKFTATGDGDVVVRTSSAYPAASAKLVSACAGFFKDSGTGWVTGVEFLDASDNSLGTTWGIDSGSSTPLGTGSSFSTWATAVVPAGAVTYRVKAKLTRCAAGQTYFVKQEAFGCARIASGAADRRITTDAYQGSKGMGAVVDNAATFASDVAGQYGLSVYGQFASPKNLSSEEQIGVFLHGATGGLRDGAAVSLRLYDTSGRFSRYTLVFPDPRTASWVKMAATLAAPDSTGPGGAADLAAVSEWVLDEAQMASRFDYMTAGVASQFSNLRGSVYQLGVLGSARSAATVGMAWQTAISDFVVASVFEEAASPLLVVAGNVATAAAPGGYDGVYSVIGAVTPATALASPTCVVAQLINGTQVASQTLAGVQATGNHYVDFGQVALPLTAVPDENVNVSYTFTLSPSSTAWADVLVLNAAAPLTWVQNLATPRQYAWVDEPVLPAQVGRVWVGSAADRSDARAPSSPPVQSRPFQVASPSTWVLAYSTSGAPNVTLDYYPRWLVEPDG